MVFETIATRSLREENQQPHISSPNWGRSRSCPALKSICYKVGSMLWGCNCASSTTNKYRRLDAKLERKMIELKRQASTSGHTNKKFRSINSVIMKFPQLKEQVKKLRGVFEHYDEDGDGSIDREELKQCFKELQVNLTVEEFDDLFESCDVDRNGRIQFLEFIVLLCLIYLITKPSSPTDAVSRTESPNWEATFDIIVQVFIYMDKNGDGKLSKKDMVAALTEPPWERSPSHVMKTRFNSSLNILQWRWTRTRMGMSLSESTFSV
ncbi:probable calcium-binding protein CML22 isoform X2 [Beta vulgaris subsp. vulgaris]|uniref:probable calcium-binding protein CML22 isoform X2 n=1 Tax=Beta vulgaris subsp. vulgaris TaxID=3555 RepID=UPI00203678CE|nr:probable calcium-binding protein CML22 isoform X2 [Beta vulgaris subsp. vulgaris]